MGYHITPCQYKCKDRQDGRYGLLILSDAGGGGQDRAVLFDHVIQRINVLVVIEHFIVEMRSRAFTRTAEVTDDVASFDFLVGRDEDF